MLLPDVLAIRNELVRKFVKRVGGGRQKRRRTTAQHAVVAVSGRVDARRRVAAWDRIEDQFRERLARNIARIRNREGFSQEVAAERAGVHPRTWQRLEEGSKGRHTATLATIARVAHALGLKDDPFELFREPD